MSRSKPLSITITEAKSWARKWQIECPNNCKAFLMPIDDLVACLEEIGVLKDNGKGNGKGTYNLKKASSSGIRAYMAIDPSVKVGGGEKLLLVATEKDSNGVHRDIIRGEIASQNVIKTESNIQPLNLTGSGVYDFTHPCPNECDPNSPLI